MKILCKVLLITVAVFGVQRKPQAAGQSPALPYCIVDTGQIRSYNNSTEIQYPKPGAAFFGQDAQYNGNQPSYRDNGDGTVTDLHTGLTWQGDPGEKKTYAEAVAGAAKCRTGGHRDWRLPTIKELYSLVLFSGTDPDPMSRESSRQRPFIDAKYFKFQYGKLSDGDRIIDSQWATSTKYVNTTMDGNETMFGVNFADGRIKGYPVGRDRRGRTKKFYVIYVRDNPDYGKNDFVDNGDGTVTDSATGLMWTKRDSDKAMNWQQALKYAEELNYAGYSDWRLPNAKELHSIVDYTCSPDTTRSAAIDPVFEVTAIRNEGGARDYPYYWTGTTHARRQSGGAGVYIAFGRALGFMQTGRTGGKKLMDVHGAGAQRCDMKSGAPSTLPQGRGPQGDVMRICNYVRCVRGGVAEPRTTGPRIEMTQTQIRQHREAGAQGAPPGEDFVRRLDRNGDGKVSRQEFDGPAAHFQRFDHNRDGYLSSDEAPQGPPPSQNRMIRQRR